MFGQSLISLICTALLNPLSYPQANNGTGKPIAKRRLLAVTLEVLSVYELKYFEPKLFFRNSL